MLPVSATPQAVQLCCTSTATKLHRCQPARGKPPAAVKDHMDQSLIAIFAAIIGFVAFELIEEMRGSHHKLMDRYHE